MKAWRFTDGGQAALAGVLAVALLLAPGCATLSGLAGKLSTEHKKWCATEKDSFGWAKENLFTELDALAAKSPDIAERWDQLKPKLLASHIEATAACTETHTTPGSVGQLIADAAGFLSEVYALFGAVGGIRDLGFKPAACIDRKAELDRLLVDIEAATGARSRAGDRELRAHVRGR